MGVTPSAGAVLLAWRVLAARRVSILWHGTLRVLWWDVRVAQSRRGRVPHNAIRCDIRV